MNKRYNMRRFCFDMHEQDCKNYLIDWSEVALIPVVISSSMSRTNIKPYYVCQLFIAEPKACLCGQKNTQFLKR